jgi:hypothetical protein
MTAYSFNEGSFDSLDVGVVDSTVHNLEFEDGSRLTVERRTMREGATIEALARDRTQHEARERPRYTVQAERQGTFAGHPGFEVAAYYPEGADVRYQLRRHVAHPPVSFVFTMTGPVAARDALDARMERVFGTLRLRA